MPAIGAHPAYYDPNRGPPTPAMDYNAFMTMQAQQAQQAQAQQVSWTLHLKFLSIREFFFVGRSFSFLSFLAVFWTILGS